MPRILNRIWRRISDTDRLCYFMTFCFGLSLTTAIVANIQGYCLYEGNTAVRMAELITGVGLMILGAWRIRRRRNRGSNNGL